MENKINVAELLKECPQGMELDCTIFDDVVFESVDSESSDCWIVLRRLESNSTFYVSRYGHYYNTEDAKCVIFPKGKTTWEGFVPPCQFKDGDIVATSGGGYVFILKKVISYNSTDVKGICYFGVELQTKKLLTYKVSWHFSRFATEEEKQKLFDAIKDKGYKWNEETKTLEKLAKPIFKIGDKIVKKNDVYAPIWIANVDNGFYYFNTESSIGMLPISDQDSYELVPDKFDISTLKPFESKVLVRDDDGDLWKPAIYGFLHDKCHYVVGGLGWEQCIPYEGNEHLLGTSNDCSEFYKTWK